MWELEIEAKTQYLEQVRAFVDGHLEMFDCPVKAKMQIDMAVEEIFVNISQYTYTYIYKYIYTHIHMYMHTYMHTHT